MPRHQQRDRLGVGEEDIRDAGRKLPMIRDEEAQRLSKVLVRMRGPEPPRRCRCGRIRKRARLSHKFERKAPPSDNRNLTLAV
jgi:hypothetical protein